NLVLVGPLEQGGLALATVVATTCGFFMGLFAFRRKRLGNLNVARLLLSMTKTLVSSLVMGFAVAFLYPYTFVLIPGHGTVMELVRIGMIAALGALIYF